MRCMKNEAHVAHRVDARIQLVSVDLLADVADVDVDNPLCGAAAMAAIFHHTDVMQGTRARFHLARQASCGLRLPADSSASYAHVPESLIWRYRAETLAQ